MTSTNSLLKTLLKSPQRISKCQAKQLHAQILKSKPSFYSNHSTLMSIYANFNLLHECLHIFNIFQSPPIRAYKSIIRCYAANGFLLQSLACFLQLRASGKYPDHNVFPSVLKSCALLLDLRLGLSLHGYIIRLGMDFDLYTCNALMNMYSKFQSLGRDIPLRIDAHKLFDRMSQMFDNFEEKRIVGDDHNVCSNQSTHVSSQINGNNKLIGGSYSESHHTFMGNMDRWNSKMDDVRKVFEMMPRRDLVSWNTVIAGYAQNGMYEEALMMIREMGNANLKPDSFTLSSVLPIFAEYVDVNKGKEIHSYVIRHGFHGDVFIGSGLINMYAKSARVEDSLTVFSILPQRDSISWNSIIAGCVQNCRFDEGLTLFRQMLKAKVKPQQVSFSSILPACALMTTLNLGKELHGYIIRSGFDDNVFIASSLVDMYAKCGNVKVARWIFDKMEQPDMVSWTAIIMGYAVHGHANDAIFLFEQMETEGITPNYVAFMAVLTACSHAGLVNKAWGYFNSMTQNFGIAPGLEHYAAMADLLGRAGKLDEAYKLISSMDRPAGSVWSALLSACQVHKNVDLAEKVAEKLFEVDPWNEGAYVLLSNIYAAAGRWKEVSKLRFLMRDKGIQKQPACSWIEVKKETHAFGSGGKSHPNYKKIIDALKVLEKNMEQEGYVRDLSEILHDVEDEQKE